MRVASATIPVQFLLLLSIWFIMGGLAVLDAVDLTDELAGPWVVWDQAIDPELEEPHDEVRLIAAIVDRSNEPEAVSPVMSGTPSLSKAPLSSSGIRPLFQRIAQYRI